MANQLKMAMVNAIWILIERAWLVSTAYRPGAWNQP